MPHTKTHQHSMFTRHVFFREGIDWIEAFDIFWLYINSTSFSRAVSQSVVQFVKLHTAYFKCLINLTKMHFFPNRNQFVVPFWCVSVHARRANTVCKHIHWFWYWMHPMNSNAQSARSNYVKKESKTKKQQLKSNRSKNHKEKTTTIEHRESEKRRMHTIPKTNERRKKASNQINKIKNHDALLFMDLWFAFWHIFYSVVIIIVVVVVADAFLVSLQWIYELLCHLKVIKMPSDADGKTVSFSLSLNKQQHT